MKLLSVLVMVGMLLATMGGGYAIAASPSQPALPVQVITHQLGTPNGFGFGRDVCPLGCQLPGPPTGSSDGAPWDVHDPLCVPTAASIPPEALVKTWTHVFSAGLQIIQALLVVNMAGIQADIYQFSTLTADTIVVPLAPFDTGALGSVPVPVLLNPSDLADGQLEVKIMRGASPARGTARCDDQYYDTSILVLLVQEP